MKEDIKRAVLSSRHGGINSRRRMAVEEEASSADSIFGAVDLRQVVSRHGDVRLYVSS
jgi:hypothetical protein